MACLTVLSLALAAGLASIGVVAHADDSNYWEQQRAQELQREQMQAERQNAETRRQMEQDSAYNRMQEERAAQQQRDSHQYGMQTPQGGTQVCQRAYGTVYCQ